MSVSIVTVALNGARDLPLTIESALGQTGADVEYIIVDGGSWDATADVLRPYAKHVDRVVRIEDAGIYYAMNGASSYCTKDYVYFLNAGDRLYASDTIQQLIERRDGDPDIFFGDHVYVDGGQEILKRAARFEETAIALREGRLSHQWHSQFPGHQATFTSRALLRQSGYDTRYRICADHDFLLRAYDRGARFQYIDEIVSHYVGGGFSASNESLCRNEWNLAYRRFSDRPRAVDAFFFRDGTSPFQHATDRTGAKVRGFFLPEGPFPDLDIPWRFSWCSGTGFTLIAPAHGSYGGIALTGFNSIAGQRLSAYSGEELLCERVIGTGRFDIEMIFDRHVHASEEIQFVPLRFIKHPDPDLRVVCLAVAYADFQRAGA